MTSSATTLSSGKHYTTGGRGGRAWRAWAGRPRHQRICTFTANQALGGVSAFGDGIGGGAYVLAGTATINNSTFTANLAQGR